MRDNSAEILYSFVASCTKKTACEYILSLQLWSMKLVTFAISVFQNSMATRTWKYRCGGLLERHWNSRSGFSLNNQMVHWLFAHRVISFRVKIMIISILFVGLFAF